jgi:hypothetical protein
LPAVEDFEAGKRGTYRCEALVLAAALDEADLAGVHALEAAAVLAHLTTDSRSESKKLVNGISAQKRYEIFAQVALKEGKLTRYEQ